MKKLVQLIMCVLLCGCTTVSQEEVVQKEPQVVKTDITINIVGDITLGNFAGMSYNRSFDQLYNKNKDKDYFFKNVKPLFEKDDLTIGNLEGTLTNAKSHVDKSYPFKGLPEYAEILKSGDFEIMSIANNHSSDYFEKGREDTKHNLEKQGIDYFGYEKTLIKEVKGKKIGLIGYSFASNRYVPSEIKNKVTKSIQKIKDETDVIIVYYHWGMMYETTPTDSQVDFAHYTIDQGADLVVGTHPHIIQGMEIYKGKNIIYSLGNFCYGGNLNPKDIDSMIYQQTFSFEDDQLVDTSYKVIPAVMSSHENKNRNNFQPKILKGNEKERWEKKFKKYSEQIR